MGTAPSQTAQALIPLCQYVSSPFRLRRLALAPVAIMTASVVSGSSLSCPSLQYLKGRWERSIFETVSVMTLVPNRIDCSRNLSINSGPNTPEGNPGKFSTDFFYRTWNNQLDTVEQFCAPSVVVVNWPPAANPLAMKPSKSTGCRFALAR